MTALDLTAPRSGPFDRMLADAPLLTRTGVLILLALVPMLLAMQIDPRLYQNTAIWLKPAKFHLALAVYVLTLAFYARWLPAGFAGRRAVRWFSAYAVFCILAELVWIGGAAAMGTGSHFNVADPVMSALYSVMGLFAVSLTALSLVYGWGILRNRDSGLPPAVHLGLWLGLVLTLPLTLVTAGTMSAAGGHLVGPAGAEGHGLWLMGWNRLAGDLRVAHFFATHAMHAIPLAGLAAAAVLSGRAATRATLAAALAYVALVGFTFWQALQGQPFLPGLG